MNTNQENKKRKKKKNVNHRFFQHVVFWCQSEHSVGEFDFDVWQRSEIGARREHLWERGNLARNSKQFRQNRIRIEMIYRSTSWRWNSAQFNVQQIHVLK